MLLAVNPCCSAQKENITNEICTLAPFIETPRLRISGTKDFSRVFPSIIYKSPYTYDLIYQTRKGISSHVSMCSENGFEIKNGISIIMKQHDGITMCRLKFNISIPKAYLCISFEQGIATWKQMISIGSLKRNREESVGKMIKILLNDKSIVTKLTL